MKHRTSLIFVILTCLLGWIAMIGGASACILDNSLTREMLKHFPEGSDPGDICLGQEPLRREGALKEFYSPRNFAPAWISERTLSDQVAVLLEALRKSPEEGLNPADYHLGPIEQLLQYRESLAKAGKPFHPSYQAVLDLLLSDAFFSLIADNTLGRASDEPEKTGIRRGMPSPDLGRKLAETLDQRRLGSILTEFMPSQPEYRALRSALARYRTLQVEGEWPQVPGGKTLHPGDRGPRVGILKERLARSADLSRSDLSSDDLFDELATEALKRFQRRHGLESDGVMGVKTLAALNVPLAQRVHQIELNMERWRPMPRSLGERYILIDIAGYWLEVREKELRVLEMPVIVGREARKTPVLFDKISHVIFGPYWNVPPTILREDVLPALRKNPNYLEKNNLEIIRYEGRQKVRLSAADFDWKKVRAASFPAVIRQRPGPQNSLGLVKFFIQNAQSIYLHDTPKKEYFEKEKRSLSSGCIRVGKPLELAEYLLRGQGSWTLETIEQAMKENINKWVPLNRPIPVYIQYWTCWIDAEGVVHFMDDIYGHDRDLDLAIGQRFASAPFSVGADPFGSNPFFRLLARLDPAPEQEN